MSFNLKKAIAFNKARSISEALVAKLAHAFQVLADLDDKDGMIGDGETIPAIARVNAAYLGINTPKVIMPPAELRCLMRDAVYPCAGAPSPWFVVNHLGSRFGGPNKWDRNHCGHDPVRKIPKGAGYPVHDNQGRGAMVADQVLAILPGIVADIHEPPERRRHYWGIILAHNIEGELWHSVYLHNDKHVVDVGDVVDGAEVLGNVGSTGTSLNHVHFSLHQDSKSEIPFVGLSVDFHKFWKWAYATVVDAGPLLEKWPQVPPT